MAQRHYGRLRFLPQDKAPIAVYEWTEFETTDSRRHVTANAVQAGARVDIWFEGDTKIPILNFQKTNMTFLFD